MTERGLFAHRLIALVSLFFRKIGANLMKISAFTFLIFGVYYCFIIFNFLDFDIYGDY